MRQNNLKWPTLNGPENLFEVIFCQNTKVITTIIKQYYYRAPSNIIMKWAITFSWDEPDS